MPYARTNTAVDHPHAGMWVVYCGMAGHCRCSVTAASLLCYNGCRVDPIVGCIMQSWTVIHYARYAMLGSRLHTNSFLTTSASVPWWDRFTDVTIGSDVPDVRIGRPLAYIHITQCLCGCNAQSGKAAHFGNVPRSCSTIWERSRCLRILRTLAPSGNRSQIVQM